MEPVLVLKDVCKNYPGFTLDHVSFEVPRGSIMGFIGENGAGKTTTIKLILNEIKRQGGSISVLGMDNQKEERKIKEQIGVVLDEGFFFIDMTSRDIAKVMRPLYRSWEDSLYSRYLREFRLPENKPIKEYSKGMKMKLSIATALAHQPKLLILDEATSGLDPVMRSEILDIFLDFIQEEDHSILLSSHITSDLEQIADYITFLHQGRIIFSRSKDERLQQYGILKCSAADYHKIDRGDIVGSRQNRFGWELLVSDRQRCRRKYPGFVIDSTTLDEIMLYYVKGNSVQEKEGL